MPAKLLRHLAVVAILGPECILEIPKTQRVELFREFGQTWAAILDVMTPTATEATTLAI